MKALLQRFQRQRTIFFPSQHQQDAELKEKNLALAYGADPLLVDRLLGQKSSKK